MLLGRIRARSNSTPSVSKRVFSDKDNTHEETSELLSKLETEHTSNRRFFLIPKRQKSRSESPSPRKIHMRTSSVPYSPISYQRVSSNHSLPLELHDEDSSQISDQVASQNLTTEKYVNKMYTIRSGEEAFDDRLNSESEGSCFDSISSSIKTQESMEKLDSAQSVPTRLTAYVYKRKNGLSGKIKSSYMKASDISHEVKHSIYHYRSKINCIAGNVHHINSGPPDATSAPAPIHNHAENNHVKIWERRKIVLDGRLLMYYHEDAGLAEEVRRTLETTPSNQAFAKFTKKILELGNYHSEINAPRGIIDLVASNATASVIPVDHDSTSPTPYRLAIMVRSEVKWLLCFDTSEELMRWLNILTNVALKQSATNFMNEHGYEYVPTEQKKDRSDTLSTAVKRVKRVPDFSESSPKSVPNMVTVQIPPQVHDSKSFHVQHFFVTDFFRIFLLVNSGFVYLLCITEGSALLSHSVVALCVNLLTVMHFRSKLDRSKLWKDHISEHSKMDSFSTSKHKQQNFTNSEFTDLNEIKHEVVQEIISKPEAGNTLVGVQSIDDDPNPGMNRWMAPSETIIQVRGDDYMKDGHKIAASTGLYNLVQVDAVDSESHMVDMSSRIKLPPMHQERSGSWKAPCSLVVSFALPMASSDHAWRKKSGSTRGYIVTCFYQMKDQTRSILKILSDASKTSDEKKAQFHSEFGENYHTIVNGVKLWENWCASVPEDEDMQKRLKFISRGENLKELGVPSWICKYNGKPVLMKRPNVTNFVFFHPDQDCMEIDINLHPFPFIFKQAMSYLKDHYFTRMLMTFAFLIEGRDEEELPEVLLGNPVQLVYPDPSKIKHSVI